MILGRVNTIYNPLALLRLTLSFGRSLRTQRYLTYTDTNTS